MYMTGLGPVANQPPTGGPASSTVASPIQARLMCHFQPHTNPAETLSAGLEPGAIGVYQATFRLPDNADAATLTGASCELCGPCDASSPFPYHGRCGDACMVSAASTPSSLRGFTPVP
jgi:ferredoxin